MKQELINKIMPNCLLPHYLMVVWINNLEFQNEPADNLRALILAELRSNGQLLPNGWELLVNNVVFEPNASITQAVVLDWLAERVCPTCAQLKQMIQDFKLKASFPLVVETNVLDLLSLDIITTADKEPSDYCKHILYIEGGTNARPETTEMLIVSRLPIFHLHNFELIQNSNAYYILERFVPAKRNKYGK